MKKLIEMGVTNDKRVRKAEEIRIDDFTEKDHVFSGQVQTDERTHEVAIDFTKGEMLCACEDWNYNQMVCKHLLGLMNRISEERIEDVDHLLETIKVDRTFGPKYTVTPHRYLSSDCVAFDEMFGGGIPRRTVSGVFSDYNVGKSILCHQLAGRLWRDEGRRTYMIDTEQAMVVDGEKYQKWMRDRFGVPDFEIDYVYANTIQKLLGLFGWRIRLRYSEEGKMDSIIIPDEERGNGVREAFEKDDYGLLIVDSITEPVEGIAGSGQESFPGRHPLNSRLVKNLRNIAVDFDVPSFVTIHLSKGVRPTSPSVPKGGRSIGFGIKYLSYLGGGQRIGKDHGERWFKRYRAVGLPPLMRSGQEIKSRLVVDYGFE